MNIEKWDIDRVMQLPDWCFGTRYPVGVAVRSPVTNPGWDISEISLPEMAVLWEVVFWSPKGYTEIDSIRIGLGMKLPTSTAQMDLTTELLKGCGRFATQKRSYLTFGAEVVNVNRIRLPIATGNRKLILELTPNSSKSNEVQVITIWSSFPKEVPDWLFLGQAGLRL